MHKKYIILTLKKKRVYYMDKRHFLLDGCFNNLCSFFLCTGPPEATKTFYSKLSAGFITNPFYLSVQLMLGNDNVVVNMWLSLHHKAGSGVCHVCQAG